MSRLPTTSLEVKVDELLGEYLCMGPIENTKEVVPYVIIYFYLMDSYEVLTRLDESGYGASVAYEDETGLLMRVYDKVTP